MPTALDDYEDKLRSLAGELAGIGFMSRGSVVERHTRCGKPGCACKADPPVLHGPYWQFSRAVAGRTVTRWITEQQAALYREWIANRRKALGILAEIEEVSLQAEAMLQEATPGQVGQVARSAGSTATP